MSIIHFPKYTIERTRFFPKNILENLSGTLWYVIPILWVPISILLFLEYKGEATMPWFEIWMVHFTLFEYCIHIFIFHLDNLIPDNSLCFIIHFFTRGIHHFLPNDKLILVMLPILSLTIASPFLLTIQLTVSIMDVSVFISRFIFGYVVYDMVHYFSRHIKLDISYLAFMKNITLYTTINIMV